MTHFDLNQSDLRSLQDKVVVLTGSVHRTSDGAQMLIFDQGGANGIGEATLELFNSRGAYVVFGDINSTAGEKVAAKYDSKRVHFLRIDVSKYEDIVALFRLALSEYGTVDHAFSIAGILEQENIFDPSLTIESVEQPPSLVVLDVNLKGTFYFTRVAAAYLHHNAKPTDDKSITFISSVAGFTGTPYIPAYVASKHGVLGLMRSLRTYLPSVFQIRINAICPHSTATAMIAALEPRFRKYGVGLNSPGDIASVILGVVAGRHKRRGQEGVGATGVEEAREPCNGLAIFVAEGRAYEIDEGLDRTQSEWLGEDAVDCIERSSLIWSPEELITNK